MQSPRNAANLLSNFAMPAIQCTKRRFVSGILDPDHEFGSGLRNPLISSSSAFGPLGRRLLVNSPRYYFRYWNRSVSHVHHPSTIYGGAGSTLQAPDPRLLSVFLGDGSLNHGGDSVVA